MTEGVRSIEQRLDDLIAWIDRGTADPDIAEAFQHRLPVDTFRQVLQTARERITTDRLGYDDTGLAIIGWHATDNMPFFETNAFACSLHGVTNNLHSMAYVLGALRKARALQHEGDYPMLPRVVAYLERIREIMEPDWSWEKEGMAEFCDAFRHFVAEYARDIYRKLGHDFRVFLFFSPSNDDHDMPKMYRP